MKPGSRNEVPQIRAAALEPDIEAIVVPVEVAGEIPVRRGPVELRSVELGVDLAETSDGSP